MSVQPMLHEFNYSCVDAYGKSPVQETQLTYKSDAFEADFPGLRGIALENLAHSTGSKKKGNNRTSLLDSLRQFLDILFPRHAEVSLIGFEGDDRQRIVIHQSNGSNIQPLTWNPGSILGKGDK